MIIKCSAGKTNWTNGECKSPQVERERERDAEVSSCVPKIHLTELALYFACEAMFSNEFRQKALVYQSMHILYFGIH